MNKILLAFTIASLFFTSCDKEQAKPLTKEQIQQQIDSVTKLRIQQVDQLAQKDLEHRIKIEVKVKADSILQVLLQQQPSADTAK
jgi:hypothetical protein